MKTDILTRQDIEELVNSFYAKVRSDAVIGFFFTGMVPINWEKYFSLMCSFWENILFSTGTYEGSPIKIHRYIHRIQPIKKEHAERWVELFTGTVDDLFAGENAELAKRRAIGITKIIFARISG